ncbi:MAG: helix-hairpin-helix domain-containing protein [Pseudomonadota bacterium]
MNNDQRIVNVNHASSEELEETGSLRGHGYEIVRYRDERGKFDSLRQLDEVPGLSGKVDEATLSLLSV